MRLHKTSKEIYLSQFQNKKTPWRSFFEGFWYSFLCQKLNLIGYCLLIAINMHKYQPTDAITKQTQEYKSHCKKTNQTQPINYFI